MIKMVFAAIIILHGLIHLMGFAKAFDYAALKQLSLPISKTTGLLWLLAAVLLCGSAALLLLKKEQWWMLALPAIIVSQIVIVASWPDAKYGTIANITLFIAAVLTWGSYHFENSFKKDVAVCLQQNSTLQNEMIVDADLLLLPPPVQRYLKYVGVVNTAKPKNVHIVFEGQMRDKGKAFFSFTSEQYNFFDAPARLFFMKAKMLGTTVPGYHRYRNATASMNIRLFGLFALVKKSGPEMNRAETVTLFNDMCLLAPASLITPAIKWQAVDDNTVKALFTNKDITISATLYFNSKGQLINFISNDRTAVSEMKNYPFSTPVHAYKNIHGFNLMSEADAVWHYPEGEFTYGKFRLKDISYNIPHQ
jgi:hypothetical protein